MSGAEYREQQKAVARKMGFVRVLPINKDTYPEELFLQLWERMKAADYAFEDAYRDDMVGFAERMIQPGTYNFEIPGEAFGQLVGAAQGTNAAVHFISLATGPTAPLTEAAHEIFWFAFEKVGVQRITATIPEFNKKVIRLATLLRMKFEGVMRQAFLYHGEYWGIHIYGILASEYRRKDN
jgi:hypothetical protein